MDTDWNVKLIVWSELYKNSPHIGIRGRKFSRGISLENFLPRLFLQAAIPIFLLFPPLPHPKDLFQEPRRLHARSRKHAFFHPPGRFQAPGEHQRIRKRPLQPVRRPPCPRRSSGCSARFRTRSSAFPKSRPFPIPFQKSIRLFPIQFPVL